MELSLEVRAGLFVLFVVVFLIGLYLQLRHFQNGRDDRIDAKLQRDELYNSIVTTRAISDSLRNQGYEVGDADSTAETALLAYEQRDYCKASELVTRAREQMFRAKCSADEDPLNIRTDVTTEGREIPRIEVSETAIQTRFLISKAAAMGGEGVDEAVIEAERALEKGDEEEALAWANRANRASCGGVVEHEKNRSCPQCGSEVPPEYRFCGSCGERVR